MSGGTGVRPGGDARGLSRFHVADADRGQDAGLRAREVVPAPQARLGVQRFRLEAQRLGVRQAVGGHLREGGLPAVRRILRVDLEVGAGRPLDVHHVDVDGAGALPDPGHHGDAPGGVGGADDLPGGGEVGFNGPHLGVLLRYGFFQLGKDDEKPQFNDLTWFCMLF